jgi:DNA-binding GntR family transcriptional regulator
LAGRQVKEGSRVLPLRELSDRRTTSDQIADVLRDAILTGEFDDGEELNQVALAKHFGVSRVPIREALRQLQAEGLVSAKAHQRTVVTSLSIDRVMEILEIRALLETHLLERTSPKLQPSDIERMRELCAEMDEITEHQAWLQKNLEFHQALYARADASFTLALLEQLSARVGRYLHRWSPRGVERNKEANAEHWAIVRAIEAGDTRTARKELSAHIAHTGERIAEEFGARKTMAVQDAARS